MANYIIASRPNSLYLAEIQALAQFLRQNAQGVRIQTIIKHSSEWSEFSQNIYRAYGFDKRCCPLVFTMEGRLIGSASTFLQEIKQKYGKIMSLPQDTLKRRSALNVKIISEEMRKKQHGPSLMEKIEKAMSAAKSLKSLNQLPTSLLKVSIKEGVTYGVRVTEHLLKQGEMVISNEEDLEFVREEGMQNTTGRINESSLRSSTLQRAKLEETGKQNLLKSISKDKVETVRENEEGDEVNLESHRKDEDEKREEGQEQGSEEQEEEETVKRGAIPREELEEQPEEDQGSFNIKTKDFSSHYTYEDFVSKYGNELKNQNKKQPPPAKSTTGSIRDSSIGKSRAVSKHETSRVGTGVKSKIIMDDTYKTHAEGDQENKNKSESKEIAQVDSKSRTRLDMSHQIKINALIPSYAGFNLVEENIAARFDQQYILAVHPLPLIEGQYLVVQLEDPPLDGQHVIKDYSLFKRREVAPKTMKERREQAINPTAIRKTPRDTSDEIELNASGDPYYEVEKSFLLNLDVDNKVPLSEWDWRFWYQAVYDCQGVGFCQILPLGARSYSYLSSKIMNMVPMKELLKTMKLDYLPLDRMISNRVDYLVKEKQKQFEDAKGARAAKNQFFTTRITQVDEYGFPHAIYVYEANPNEKALKNGFMKCYTHLNEGLGQFKETGMIILLHTKFLFVAPLLRPYLTIKDRDLYVDALAYLGVFTLPVLKKEWPQTAGIDKIQMDPLEILKKSSSWD